VLCKICEKELGNRNKSGYCSKCRSKNTPRCKLCGKITCVNGDHKCSNVDLQGERYCEICNCVLKNSNWERWSKICRKCSKRKWRRIEKDQRKQLILDWGGKCKVCGYNKCVAALNFHHKDSSEKYEWNVKGKAGASIREIKSHPERFELVCVRCHVEIHHPEELNSV
jgi:hypothetical protein